MLKGKTILLGVTGSIAAYKIANLASMLKKLNANVEVIMTKNACNFIHPITFETLTGNKCLVDTFDRNFEFKVEHIALAKRADVVLIAPASANCIGKLANGICDDMLTTTVFACTCPILIAPAMNSNMFLNPILQDNLKKLERYQYKIITPTTGHLACGDIGIGKMPSEDLLLEYILEYILKTEELKGKSVLITAGPTRENIDPVRYITNHSTGKMGYALAKQAYLMGAEVMLISGEVEIKAFHGIQVVPVVSAKDMFDCVKEKYKKYDYIIMCAAVADYTPEIYSNQKIKKTDKDMVISLKRTEDILMYLGQHRTKQQKLIGFCMETEDVLTRARKKLKDKNADMICANLVSDTTGFGVDTNQITLITENNEMVLPLMSKEQTARQILEAMMHLEESNDIGC